MTDSSSPSSDRVGSKLNESNFLQWKDSMMGLLMAKRLWQYVIKEHPSDDINDQQAKGFIWMNVEHSQHAHLNVNQCAHDNWKVLCTKHEKIGPQVIVNCIFGIANLRFVDDNKMEDHLDKVREYYTRLDAVNCQLPDTVKAAFLLNSLPASWEGFQQMQSASASDANPLTVSGVSLAILVERDRRLNRERANQTLIDTQASALAAAQRQHMSNRRERDDVTCTYCGKPNHEESKCWKKHGRPPRTPRDSHANVASQSSSSSGSQSTNSNHVAFTAISDPPDSGLHPDVTWYLDSGASNHYCHLRELVKDIEHCSSRPDVKSAGGDRMPIMGCGSVFINLPPDRHTKRSLLIKVSDVCFVPTMTVNLLSVSRITAAGYTVEFGASDCKIKEGKRVIAVADLVKDNNLYRLRTVSSPVKDGVASQPQYCLAVGEPAQQPPSELWHQRLGHLNHRAVSMLLGRGMTADIQLALPGDTTRCDACILGKHHRSATHGLVTTSRATRPLFRLHLDICGPFSVEALDGSLYLLQVVDDYSRYVWARGMPNRLTSTVLSHFKEIVAQGEAMHSGHRVSVVRSDNGPELISAAFSAFLQARGIRRERTATYSPHQNGVVERMNRAVVELGRTMLISSSLPATFWMLAMDTAAYCRNRCPTTSLDEQTPFEAWTHLKPRVAHMRIFGCLAYVHIRKEERHKLDPKAKPCVFVGYPPDSSTYRLWSLQDNKLIESRDVYFVESQLGIKARGPTDGSASSASPLLLPRLPPPDADVGVRPHLIDDGGDSDDSDMPPLIAPPPNSALSLANSQAVQHPQPPAQPAKPLSARAKRELERLKDHLHAGPKDLAPSTVANFALITHSSVSHSTNGILDSDPTTHQAAINSPQQHLWRAAMDSEMTSLEKAGTYKLVSLPANRVAIGCKWVYKTKRGADGSIIKHKARLVAKGYLQKFGVDYDETYAPVARYPSIRAILALTAHHDWELHQMDVKSAYLNGDLEEDIYMTQPEGYVVPGKDHLVCKLDKSLYGLKQAGRTWHLKIDVTLQRQGFTPLDADHCVYTKQDGQCITIIALYVDDLLIACSSLSELLEVKKRLTAQFDMEDLGEASFLLGIDIRRDRARRTISISQSAYIAALLERHGMSDCKSVSTPMDRDSKTTLNQPAGQHPATDKAIRDYQAVIGGVMFAMICTRPDIAFAVTTLAQFASNPSPIHEQAVKRVLRYLRGTIDQRITYTGTGAIDSQPSLVGYTDADWGGGHGCRSVTGYAFMLAGGVISWQSKKQKTVALSTVEAEYMATTQGAKEAVWWRSFLSGLGHDITAPTMLHSDNQGSIALAHNPEHHARTKHINIQHHFIRELVADKTIDLTFIGTEDMIADILTKALDRTAFNRCARRLGLSESSSRGGVNEAR
jgi:transposase InsO family protein